ncbi:MAG: cation:proton antiporter [Gammaproteobacteria bacterium]|nr:cation:proton antiporter [Gammaproteobacteria bacterium]
MSDTMKRRLFFLFCFLLLGCFGVSNAAFSSSTSSGSGHLDPVASVVLWVTLIFFFGLIGRYVAQLLHQPGVLGELLMGVLLGNICYFFGLPLAIVLREGGVIFDIMSDVLSGTSVAKSAYSTMTTLPAAQQVTAVLQSSDGIDLIRVAYVVDSFSRYGVIFLLFMVGLETSIDEIKHTGKESLRVALLGVLVPILLGFLVSILLLDVSLKTDLFLAATLSATSVGITARVLKELRKLRTREAKTILGAAMIDDVLGLIILAMVSSVVLTGIVNIATLGRVLLQVVLFFTGVLLMGPWVLRRMVGMFRFLEPWESKLAISFIFVMALSWLATVVQLASIIGAFAAGLIIHDGFFDGHALDGKRDTQIRELVAPLESLLAPLFFMLIGIQVKLEAFLDWHVLLISVGLTVAAVLGKLVSGIGASKTDDRLLIGVGMLPRGEVGIVFASIGRTLGVLSDDLFSAIILMVIITTFIAPPWIKQRYTKHPAPPKKKVTHA